jgi:hypothetical protein
VDNSDEISGFAHQSPALDSIQEIQVLVNGFKAEYGQASGGVVNVITRSGTNNLRGSGLFLFQDDDLRSRSPYADRSLPPDPFQRLQYGATIGGPIQRDKTHLFAAYEREDRDTFTSTTSVYPSTAEINAASASTRQFLASNNIDISRFGAGGRLRLVRPEFVDVHKMTARVDQQLNTNQYFTVRHRRQLPLQPRLRSRRHRQHQRRRPRNGILDGSEPGAPGSELRHQELLHELWRHPLQGTARRSEEALQPWIPGRRGVHAVEDR